MKNLMIAILAALFGLQPVGLLAKTPAEKRAEQEKKHQEKLQNLRQKLEHEREERRRKIEELQIKAEITNEKFEYSQPDWKGKLGLTCPDREDYDRVVVSHWAANQRIHYNIVHVALTVFNNTEEPQNIFEDGHRTVVVENLCPGGSITLERSLDLPHNALDVSWTAQPVNGGPFSQSPRYHLWRQYNWGYSYRETRQTGRWCIGGCELTGSQGSRQ